VKVVDTPRFNEDGATAVEYAIMVSMIAVVIVASVTLFGRSVVELFAVPWP
jgi:Flp pilus assembly pilin Flp